MSTEKEKDTYDIQIKNDEIEESNNTISLLPPKMQRFIHLYMTGQYTLNKLAQLLEVHPNTLTNWLRRKDVKEIIADMQVDTHDMVAVQLKALTLKAVTKLGSLTESPIDGVALQAVKDILDRAGHKPKNEIKVDKTVTTIEQKFKELVDATIDVDYEVIDE